jgi:hypothetical protein
LAIRHAQALADSRSGITTPAGAVEAALVRSERDAAAHVHLAGLDEQGDRFADARRHAERAMTLDPDLAESRGLLGRITQAHQRVGNAAAATREFDEARRAKEQEVGARAQRGPTLGHARLQLLEEIQDDIDL